MHLFNMRIQGEAPRGRRPTLFDFDPKYMDLYGSSDARVAYNALNYMAQSTPPFPNLKELAAQALEQAGFEVKPLPDVPPYSINGLSPLPPKEGA